MIDLLVPDARFDRLSAISIEHDLKAHNFSHALIDMDNTVVSRADHLVPKDIQMWIYKARAAGIRMCLLSNNWHRAPYDIAAQLEIPVVAKAMKPLPHAFFIARDRIDARSGNTVVIGDQPSTDVVGAHILGMNAYLVEPLARAEEPVHTRFVRQIEQAIIPPQPQTSTKYNAACTTGARTEHAGIAMSTHMQSQRK